jgi:ATP-dependent Clp protease ATP-binding subunit ClpC
LLVGPPGVGRLGIAKEMARRVRNNEAHPALNGLNVVYLHVGELLAQGNTNAGELAIISRVLAEMERAGNIIAIIDGLGSILGGEDGHPMNLTEMLLPFFSSLTVKVVVILSSDEYHLHLRSNEELIHFFEVVEVPSASEEETLQVLAAACPMTERESGVYLPYKSLRALVEGTSGILQQVALPERVFDILDEVIVEAQTAKQYVITADIINKLITKKVGVPVGQIEEQERENLLNLDEIMHTRLINQTYAVSAVARAMIRARAGVRNRHRPIGTFLFMGPTGVGKTETAKTLAAVYFGSEDNMIRLDMSEFQSETGVAALMGDASHPVGQLASMIQDKPFTVLLLDEFEKAHTTVQQLFLPILDEGQITDSRGQVVSFQHAIIIATSNAGAEYIRESYKDGALPQGFDQQLRDYILRQNIFKPELVNRFDGVITFTPLSPEHVKEIAILMLKGLNKRLDAKHGITVDVNDDLINFLVENGYDPEFGARPMTRLIQDTVEYQMAQKVLQGTAQPGQPVMLPIESLRALLAQERQ